MITSVAEMQSSVDRDADPPEGLSAELRALWLSRKGRWEEAHEIAQDIPSATGSWIHAHLHVIEGDLWNAGYWYSRAGRPESPPGEIDAEWGRLVQACLGEGTSGAG